MTYSPIALRATTPTRMQVIDLFSGIGGFGLAARWAGWQTVQFCEIEPFCQAVLAHHWPTVPIHNDIKTLTREQIIKGGWQPDKPTIVVGGFPCQPYSAAGKRKGTDDERHLWPEMLRIIQEVQPQWVVGENVHGFVTWSGGLVFEQAALDLEAEGYEVQPYVLPACGVNAPHKRDRVWIVAHASEVRRDTWRPEQSLQGAWPQGSVQQPIAHANQSRFKLDVRNARDGTETRGGDPPATLRPPDAIGVFTNANGSGCQKQHAAPESNQPRLSGGGGYEPSDWRGFPTQSPIRGRNDGIPAGLDGRSYRRHVRESIQAYGNAIVPQVALQIFRAINAYNAL